MDFHFTGRDISFRDEVRQFLASNLPPEMARRQRLTKTFTSNTEDSLEWMRILDRKGWSVPHWDKQYGGTDWTPVQKFIFENELCQADAPEFHMVSTHLAGPTIYMFGSDEQKERFLPAIRTGEYIWCQGFSEPGAGSDLASLETVATLEGENFRVRGQKIWTSAAFEARWGFFLVKTDTSVKPQAGISFLLIDMQSDGITVRRIPQINGEAHLCEVFLDDVLVPVSNLVGEPGKGWGYAKALLDHERTASSFIFFNKRELRRAFELAASTKLNGKLVLEDPHFRMRLALLETEVAALEWSVLRVLANEEMRYGTTVAASALKLTGSRLQQAITELQTDMLGARSLRYFDPYAVVGGSPLWPEEEQGRSGAALIARASTIYGGTEQIQKNILSKLAFGL